MGEGLTILMYHRVLPAEQCSTYLLDSLVVSETVFAQQVRWLAKHCRVLPVREAIEALHDKHGSTQKPLVALTFDDGYADNGELAAPILEASGVRGTFFITTGFVETGEPMWFDRAAELWRMSFPQKRVEVLQQITSGGSIGFDDVGLPQWMETFKQAAPQQREQVLAGTSPGDDSDRYRAMSRVQVAELHAQGHEVASHTQTHPILPQLNDQQLADELTESRKWLEACLDAPCTGFCYPNGDVDARVESAVREAGYSYGCTTRTALNEPGVNVWRLSRVPVTMRRTCRSGRHDELGFRAEISGLRALWRR